MKKNKIKNLQGSIVALVTPFAADNTIDYQALKNLIEWQIASGTSSILVCGTTGENPTLYQAETHELIAFTVKQVNGRIPVIAGVGSNSTQSSITNAQTAQECGVDALLVVGPYYNKPTNEGFYLHFSAIAKSVDLPIIVYNVPGRTSKNIVPEVLFRLAKDHANIVGIKEASGDINQIMTILHSCPAGFKVFSGDDALTLAVIALGGDGCISVVANEIPQEFAELNRVALQGDFVRARQLHHKYLNLMTLNFIESNPIPVKTALAVMGRIQEKFRLPMCPMTESTKKQLMAELTNLKLI